MMSHTVQIHGDSAIFPGDACVHCLHPATEQVDLVRVKRSAVRRVSVPFCDECISLRKTKSTRQVQFERIAAVVSFLLAWAAGVWAYVFFSSWDMVDADHSWTWGLLLGALAMGIVVGSLYLIVRPWSRTFRSPETKAVLASVKIRDFDWETTTLDFADKEYAERFALVNQANQVEPSE